MTVFGGEALKAIQFHGVLEPGIMEWDLIVRKLPDNSPVGIGRQVCASKETGF